MMWQSNFKSFGTRPALITESVTYSYLNLIESMIYFSPFFGSRCLVFIVSRNSPASVIGYLSALQGHCVPVMINSGISSELLKNLLAVYRPKYLYLPKDEHQFSFKIVRELDEYILVETGYNKDYLLHQDLALLLTTSGSTGSPKLVRLSYENLNSNTNSIAQYLDITKYDRAITTMPMSYTYGLSIINSHLSRGASIALTDKSLMTKDFWAFFRLCDPTTFGGVPYIYEMLKKLRFAKMELPSLKYITQAGGKLSLELSEEFANFCKVKGVNFIVMYGQTEATARMSYLPPEYALTKAGSMGIAIPGGTFWLLDENGEMIHEPDMPGELVYQGENVALGYAESCQDLKKGDENFGVLYTGDIAKRDSDGFYTIVGRKKRFLKLFGNRINLDEVEGILKAAGFDCACTGTDDAMKIYFIEPQDPMQIREHITLHTNVNMAGVKIIPIEKFPRNTAGKVLYGELRESS